MRFLNIASALAVLICNILVSYNHSIQLFQSGGFTGWMAHVAVVGAEVTFVMGALNIVVARLRGVSPGLPAVMGGLLGIALVSWSNMAAGWAYGATGILLGLATPISLIVAESILSRAIIQGANNKTNETVQEEQHVNIELIQQNTIIENEQDVCTQYPPESEQVNVQDSISAELEVHDTKDDVQMNEEVTERTPLYLISSKAKNTGDPKPTPYKKGGGKTEQACEYVVKLIEQNKPFTVREVASVVGCSPSTAQTAINRAKELVDVSEQKSAEQ